MLMRPGLAACLLAAVLLAGFAVAAGCGAPPEGPAADAADAHADAAAPDASAVADSVRALLQTQAAAWNEGDLEGFMAGYARTDTLRFASGDRVRTGWQATLDAYRRGYPDRQTMGTLAFEGVDVTPLAPDAALAFGRWTLTRTEADGARGLFTLVLQRTPDGWRIVHDHTSAAAAG
jgi:uncharacterized protein (TIGR02246 family)